VREVVRESAVPVLLGSDQYEWRVAGTRREVEKSFNAAFMLRPDGTTGGVYRKMHLVPWGEYVPLKDWLTFVGPLVQAIGRGFDAGDTLTLLPVGSHRISTAICYEIIYPELVRRSVVEGSELLTTITNDAWYGRSSAAYQHRDQASMRAIENGRYLARAANTGISGFVDPYGRVLGRSDLFEQRILIHDLLLTGRAIYSRTGDLVAWLSLALVIAAVLASRR
jgi:apolipoprotein N-acyltransferase